MGKYKALIDTQEFHEKLLDLMTSEKIDDFFNNSIFARKENSDSYKAAMIHGICIASMMISACDRIFVKEIDECR